MPDDRRVVVLGSGPAGATAALFLVQSGLDVTLLEAGPARAAAGVTARLAGLTLARMHRPLLTRADGVTITGDPHTKLFEDLAPGGLTNHWSCAVPRFSRDDFADARRAGEVFTWPIGYEDLVPWYDRVEPLLQIAGAGADAPQLPGGHVRKTLRLAPAWTPTIDRARDEGQGLVPVPYAFGSGNTLTLSGTVFNSFVRMLKPIQSRLAIRFDSPATSLEWSGPERRVTAVIYRDAVKGGDHRLPCRAVVVAAGAVNSAKLLLQSQSTDFPDGLGNTDGVLGRYLTDHPLGKVEFDLAAPLPIQPPAYLTRPPLHRSTPLYTAACSQWGGSGMLLRSVMAGRPGAMTWSGFNLFGTMAPDERNFVALDRSRAYADGSPGLEVHIHHPDESSQALATVRDQWLALLDATTNTRPRVRNWLIEPVGGSVHFAGTCRMHVSPRFGVLDAWSRLHAVPNVVVADSAAFTTHPEKNPVLTAMALAARASERLADDLRRSVV